LFVWSVVEFWYPEHVKEDPIPKEDKTDFWFSTISSFDSIVVAYVRLPFYQNRMATHADVAPADLDIFMLHFMLSAFRFFSC
jgi:hypothetical protein